ncbi:MAG: serine/threonine protein kinase [Planctomycetes bacterium]|nr:serine/threonine protein kinase [Planctomycetota bacterium]
MAVRSLGPFELEQKIGAGGMGFVYRAKYIKTGQIVALKILPSGMAGNDKAAARFDRELSILKQLRHPNIIRCFGGGLKDNQRFYAMELVEGGSLAKLIKQRGKLSWEETVEYGIQICSALQHAHDNGIIHRDLKPANLLLTKKGELKLADFGIALDLDATALTAAGKTVGTFTYMAPEQICGKPPVSHKSDLYALGCVMFKMLSGQPPFDSESAAELLHQHLYKAAPRVSTLALDCPVWLDTLISQLLDKNPFNRPRDASAVARALEEVKQKVASNTGVTQHAVSGAPTAFAGVQETAQVTKLVAAKKKRKPVESGPIYERAWFLAVCLLLLIGFMTWALWPKSEAELFARAVVLMETDDPVKWNEARDAYLLPLLEKFPQGQFAAKVQDYLDRIEMAEAERRFQVNTRLGKEPRTEAERLFAEAWRYEQFGDRILALEKYQALSTLLKDDRESRPWVHLARRQISRIEESGSKTDSVQLVDETLAKADQLAGDGKQMPLLAGRRHAPRAGCATASQKQCRRRRRSTA